MNSAAEIWERVLTLMEQTMTKTTITTWFSDAEAVALEESRFILYIPTDFKKEIVEKYPHFRFDMSEWCELTNKSHTKNFKGALITARIIGQDLAYAGAESWTSWVAVNQFSIKEDGNDYSDAHGDHH